MDPFALLGLPRQPWLEPAAIRAAFQERSRTLHPDAAGGDAGAFARLNAAQQELAVVSRRLRRLAGDHPLPAVPPDPELAFEVAGLLPALDAAIAAGAPPVNPLLAALEVARRRDLRDRLAAILARVTARRTEAEARVRATDAREAGALAALATEFSFLERWDEQLRRRELELRIQAPGGAPA